MNSSVFSAPTVWQVTEILCAPGSTETFEVPEPTFWPSTLSIVTVTKLPGRNEKAHTLESAEIVACVLGALALLEFMFWVAHAGKITPATTGKRHFFRNAKSILPVLNIMSDPHRHAAFYPQNLRLPINPFRRPTRRVIFQDVSVA
jgi:hypothetical protein